MLVNAITMLVNAITMHKIKGSYIRLFLHKIGILKGEDELNNEI